MFSVIPCERLGISEENERQLLGRPMRFMNVIGKSQLVHVIIRDHLYTMKEKDIGL